MEVSFREMLYIYVFLTLRAPLSNRETLVFKIEGEQGNI